MDITKQQIDTLNAVVKIKVGPADYQSKVETALKNYQKRANMPGFRPGKVPTGMIKKMYGKTVLAEELNRLLQHSLYEFIEKEKIEILGNPLPKKEEEVDFESQTEFEFTYDLGLAPQFSIDVSDKTKFTYYLINVDDTLIDKYVNDIARNFGKVTHPETIGEQDVVFGDFVELDAHGEILAGGIFKSTTLAMDRIKNEKFRNQLLGGKEGSKVVVNAQDISENKTDLAATLGVETEKAETINANFQFTVKNISRMEPAAHDQELFDKVYGKDKVHSLEEFRAKVKEELIKMFDGNSERKLKNDIEASLLKTLNLQLPDEFLKRWLKAVNEKPLTDEQVENEYPKFSEHIKWQLIENKIIKSYELKVTTEEAEEDVKQYVRSQYERYGRFDTEEEEITRVAKEILGKEEDAKKVYQGLYDKKIMELFKSKFKLENKTVTQDEFNKL